MKSIATVTVLSLALVSACSNKPDASAPGAAVAAIPPESSHAAAAAPATAPESNTAQGPVVETMDASNYTYVRVKTAGGDIWAATSTFKVKVGDTVVVPLENPMANFESQTLKRTFPLIYFTSSIGRPGDAGAGVGAGGQTGSPSAGTGQMIDKIPGAPGGVTVASIVTNRTAMAGKTVTIRGKVVKYNGGILGLNWLHVQDGSGAVKDGSNDITVTSTTTAAVGDIVTVTGTVVIDKDFGAGYNYAVLLQNATVTVK